MNESEFHTIADQAIADIQDAIDDSGADIDYEEVGGVLTLEFENGTKIIFSKQPPAKQLWMAARSVVSSRIRTTTARWSGWSRYDL